MGRALRRIGERLVVDRNPDVRLDLPAALLISLSLFAVYAALTPPGLTGGDGAELLYGLETFQTVHSPGYPLYLVVGRALLRTAGLGAVPGGHQLSAVFGALALGVLYLFLRDRGIPAAWSASGVLLLAVSYPVWQVCVQVEVYSLALLFFTGSLLFWSASSRGAGGEHLFALWVGLSFTHHPMAVLNLLLFVHSLLRGGKNPGWGLAWLVAPAALYGLLLVPGTGFAFNWPQPGTLNDVLGHASATTFGGFVLQRGLRTLVRGVARLLATHLVGLPGAVLLVVAAGYVSPPDGWWPLIALQGVYCTLLALYDVPDLHHFLLPSLVVAAGLGAAGLSRVHGRTGTTTVLLLLAACLLSVYGYGSWFSLQYDYRDHTYPERYVRSVSEAVGEGVVFADWSRYTLLRHAQLRQGRLRGVDLLSPTPGYAGWKEGIPHHLRRGRTVYTTVRYRNLPAGARLEREGMIFRVRR